MNSSTQEDFFTSVIQFGFFKWSNEYGMLVRNDELSDQITSFGYTFYFTNKLISLNHNESTIDDMISYSYNSELAMDQQLKLTLNPVFYIVNPSVSWHKAVERDLFQEPE